MTRETSMPMGNDNDGPDGPDGPDVCRSVLHLSFFHVDDGRDVSKKDRCS